MKTFSIFEALRFGWNVAKSHVTFFIPVILIALVIPSILNGLGRNDHNSFTIVTNLIGVILTLYFSIGLIRISVKFASGQEAEFSDLYKNISVSLFLNFVAAIILSALGIFVGFIFLIIPGIYLSLRWSLLQYAIVDRNSGILEAFHLSSEWTKGNKVRLLGLGIMGSLVALAGFLALVIGLFWAIPTVLVAHAFVYKKLSSEQ